MLDRTHLQTSQQIIRLHLKLLDLNIGPLHSIILVLHLSLIQKLLIYVFLGHINPPNIKPQSLNMHTLEFCLEQGFACEQLIDLSLLLIDFTEKLLVGSFDVEEPVY